MIQLIKKITFSLFMLVCFLSFPQKSISGSMKNSEPILQPSIESANYFLQNSCQLASNKFSGIGSEKSANSGSTSKGKAIFRSFLIPGWGEFYAGRKKRARNFFVTEVLLWSAYASFKIYENWIEKEYTQFAKSHARIDPTGKPHKYFVNIGNYDNIYEYNATKLNHRQLEDVYPADHAWQWDNTQNRTDFEAMRIRADNSNYRAQFMLGVILVNHVVSAIDAVWVTRSSNKPTQSNRSLNFKFAAQSKHGCHQFGIITSF